MTEERGHRKVKPLTHKSRYTAITATINNVTDVSTKMNVCVKNRASFIGGLPMKLSVNKNYSTKKSQDKT